MRIGILGQPCIDENVFPGRSVRKALGGVLYSFAAMERIMRGTKGSSFVPVSWLSNPDRDAISAFTDSFQHLERTRGFWPADSPTNQVQLVYRDDGSRTEHCSHILPPLTKRELSSELLESLDGLFVNMISGYDITIETLEESLQHVSRRPFVHLDIHALILGSLSNANQNSHFGSGREPRGVKEWKRWLAIADSVQMNELEARWLADPEIQSEDQLLKYLLSSKKCPRLQYAVLTRAERGATLYDWNQKLVHHAEVPNVKVVDTTGSGDVFGSAFLFAILAGLMPERSLERAVQWASWNATLTSIEEILTSENE
jgi:hypothetical protein